jgi:type 1 fimbriae regulatory protein FimB/type 1 fimbriae regulatory protein FimE
MRANLKLVKPSPIPVNGTVPPKRTRNADVRPREYLTPKEVERLIKAARARGRYGARDATAILVTYRHGHRASELAELR